MKIHGKYLNKSKLLLLASTKSVHQYVIEFLMVFACTKWENEHPLNLVTVDLFIFFTNLSAIRRISEDSNFEVSFGILCL